MCGLVCIRAWYVYPQLPTWALDAACNEVTDEEKLAVPEFFCGRPIKTPER